MHSFIFNPYILKGLAAVILLSITILWLRHRLISKIYGAIYECVDYFTRNCHDIAFYSENQNYISKYQPIFEKCKKNKSAWYLRIFGKTLIDKFLVWYEETQTFTQ